MSTQCKIKGQLAWHASLFAVESRCKRFTFHTHSDRSNHVSRRDPSRPPFLLLQLTNAGNHVPMKAKLVTPFQASFWARSWEGKGKTFSTSILLLAIHQVCSWWKTFVFCLGFFVHSLQDWCHVPWANSVLAGKNFSGKKEQHQIR